MAVGFDLPPVDMKDGAMRLQRHPMIKITAQPTARSLALPIHGMLCTKTFAPVPPRFAPEFSPAVALPLDKLGEFALCNRRASDDKGRHFDWMRPLFVVEDKRLLLKSPQQKRSSWNLHVPAQGSRFARTRRVQPGKNRRTPAISLTCVGEGLRVHVLVEHAQGNEITFLFGEFSPFDALQHAVAHGHHVSQRVAARRQRQTPTAVM